jgi:16S rRNA (cytosine1402-N4)-methyltransferase
MLSEVLEAIQPRSGGTVLDGTLGGAGHAAAILGASAPDGRLFGMDRDEMAIEAARSRLAEFGERVELKRGNYAKMAEWLGPGSCDGVLLDLGVSSPQLDWAERGFSFQADGPLDMRMDQRQPLTAAELVNGSDERELAEIFWKLGEERQSRRFAREIVAQRAARPFRTTKELADLIERVTGNERTRRRRSSKRCGWR